jgi:hypothetical protein
MNFTRISRLLFATLAVLGMAGTANATIVITPSTAIPGLPGMGPSNCEPGCVETIFGTTGLSELYKSDEDGGLTGSDSGPYAGSYATWFYNSVGDPGNALLFYTGGPDIDCPSCYLAIKDGNSTPGYYFYDLSAWNGTETISMEDFWPGRGAISHISIWGRTTTTNVPEPSTMALLGLGLLAVGFAQRRRQRR